MKFTLEKKIIFFFFLAAIALLSVMLIFYYNAQKIKSTNDLVEQTQEVLRKSDDVLLDVLNIETGSRGYSLTGNENYLEPFDNAVITINSNIEKLALLTKDNLNQQSRVDSLKKVVNERLVFTKKTIEAKKKNKLNETGERVLNGTGKLLTDIIRSIIVDINSEELRLLTQRRKVVEEDTKNFTIIFMVLFAIIIIILSSVYILITSNLKVRQKAEEKLQQLNKELAYQNTEKEKRADELIIANKELAYQNTEKEKRADELIIANKELAYQNTEKEKRADELIIANNELAYQNTEKENRADELIIANKELAYQNEEKEKRADELIIANKELNFQNGEKEKHAAELILSNTELKKTEEQLITVNKELETFTYSVSHDLRAPLRAINGYSKILKEDYTVKLDADGMSSLNAILNNSKKMGELIDDLLAFSRLGRKALTTSEINMNVLVRSIKEEELIESSKKTEFVIQELPSAMGQQSLIRQVWVNLISNALKFSKYKPKTIIEIGSYFKDDLVVYYVKDKGAGFDMQYYDKLFGIFQRLHSQEEFEGTGIGLAIVQKIINRHNGMVWAESKLNEGSCFYFSLPIINS